MKREIFYNALQFATKAHDGQWRKGSNSRQAPPYVVHCIEVAQLMDTYGGVKDEEALSIALLHDVVEDTAYTLEDISDAFGPRVARGVELLTLPPECEGHPDKKLAFQSAMLDESEDVVKWIKLCDKTCNVRDLIRYQPQWRLENIRSYAIKSRVLCDKVITTSEVPQGILKLHQEVYEHFERVYGSIS